MFKHLFSGAALVALGLLLTAGKLEATHFRYGHLVWRTVSANAAANQYTAAFHLYNAFRRSSYTGSANDGLPAIGDIIRETAGGTNLNFGDGTSTATLNYYVLNVDPQADWLYAVAVAPGSSNPNEGIRHTYAGPQPRTAYVDACCRLSSLFNSPDGAYRVETLVAFDKTAVSPTSTVPIIVQCPAGQVCNFPVPAADPENQILRYRLAADAESYMAPLNGLTINPTTGLATFQTPNVANRLFAAQVVIEKRNQASPADVMTKVAVDFLIRAVATLPQGQAPSFQSPTPVCGQQITIQPGQQLQFGISARTNNPGGTVVLNMIGQPPGAVLTPALPVSGSPTVSSVFKFTPGAAQSGTYQMNFTAVEGGQQTACGFSIVVPAPNTVISLVGARGGNMVRLQAKVAGSLCGVPTYTLFRRVGGTGVVNFTPIATGAASAFQTTLAGITSTVSEYYVQLSFANQCAASSQSNVLTFMY